MKNPWLNIPASDYEGHMSLPGVDQLSFLGEVFKRSLAQFDCSSLACLGCATGNGLEFVRNEKTHKVTVIDINPEYLEILRNRYQGRIANLETIEADLNSFHEHSQRYSLIYAGLLFEYLSPGPLLKRIRNWLEDSGVMVVVLQLQGENTKKISDTPYSSIQQLDPIMTLVSDLDFKMMAKESGLKEREGNYITLASGKTFYVGAFVRN